MLEKILRTAEKFMPRKIFRALQPAYHLGLSFLGALFYGFPSRRIKIVAVTGTKGKSTTVELINAVLEESGYKTAVAGTIRFKIGRKSERNLYKMTMPGRFAMQRFLRKAAAERCDWAVIEMTSEGARFYRHKFIELDSLVFTNISPEHIESHGSYEKYLGAKLKIAAALENSRKKERWIIANGDDAEAEKFTRIGVEHKRTFGLSEAMPYKADNDGLFFTFEGEWIKSPLRGEFNLYNLLAAMVFAESVGISLRTIKKAVEKMGVIKGRVEKIEEGQDFEVVVDYAHTPDSLQKFYSVFKNRKNICVLGNTGGGRDKWKRAGMAKIAEKNCQKIILTNEDPYDEKPEDIVRQMAEGIGEKEKLEIVMDRRLAIRRAAELGFEEAAGGEKCAVLITGKGTDPYIMEAGGRKTPWSDEEVAREEIRKVMNRKNRAGAHNTHA